MKKDPTITIQVWLVPHGPALGFLKVRTLDDGKADPVTIEVPAAYATHGAYWTQVPRYQLRPADWTPENESMRRFLIGQEHAAAAAAEGERPALYAVPRPIDLTYQLTLSTAIDAARTAGQEEYSRIAARPAHPSRDIQETAAADMLGAILLALKAIPGKKSSTR